jgi:hypothetical protein
LDLALLFFILVLVRLTISDIKRLRDEELKQQTALLSMLTATNDKLKLYEAMIAEDGDVEKTSVQPYDTNDLEKILTPLLTTLANQEAGVAETKAIIEIVRKQRNLSPSKIKKVSKTADLRAQARAHFQKTKLKAA